MRRAQVTRVKSGFYLTTAIGSGRGWCMRCDGTGGESMPGRKIAALTAGLLNLLLFRFVIFPSEQQFNAHGVQVLLWAGLEVSCVWILVLC